MRTSTESHPKNHTYSFVVIELAISLVIDVGVSFRGASKLFVMLNLYLELNIGTPTHTTILNWTKKQGVSNFREKSYFKKQKWILIADESIQFGNNKLLFITAVPAHEFNKHYLIYSDLIPLVIKVSTSWKGKDIVKEIEKVIDSKQVLYAVSDNGNNLVNVFNILNIKHIEDINHKFSWIIQKILEEEDVFKSFSKELSNMRAKLSLSKQARIIPPNQRIMSRYMNLTPIFEWSIKMLELLERDKLTIEEKEKLAFLPEYKKFILEMHELINVLNQTQKIMKNSGFSKKNVKSVLKMLNPLNGSISKKISEMVANYLHETKQKMGKQKTILCSSDIVESCFGKYKELVETNKTVGINDLSLCLSTMMTKDSQMLKTNFERIKTEDVKAWKKENIGQTLFAEKKELFKKIG